MKKFALLLIAFYYFSGSLCHAESRTVLLSSIARDAILETLTGQKRIDREGLIKEYTFLGENGAAFVTLNKQRRLRGCIGSLKAFRPLIDDVAENAKSAAFRDNRFYPLTLEEVDELEIEVSVLSTPEKIEYTSVEDLKAKVKVNEDGIILKAGAYRATYLPQVWEQMNGFDEFFSYLCRKAGMDAYCLQLHPSVYRYGVRKYDESTVRTRPMANAGTFYPDTCIGTEMGFDTFGKKALRQKRPQGRIKALIVPHAGYKYSGLTADFAYRMAAGIEAEHVVVLGPSHFNTFKGISTIPADGLRTPCGMLVNDESLIMRLQKTHDLVYVPQVHNTEHSTEVQFPFIHRYLPSRRVTELVYGEMKEGELRALVTELLKMENVLLIVSTDLSHYHTQEQAHKIDYACLDAMTERDPERLKRCEACGIGGLTALLEATKTLGLKTRLIDYRTSADASGDTARVVGYMSAVVYE